VRNTAKPTFLTDLPSRASGAHQHQQEKTMDAITAPSHDLMSGDQSILTATFYATIDNQARRRGKPEPSDDLTGLLNPKMMDDGGITFIPQPSFANQVASSILDAGLRALRDNAEGHLKVRYGMCADWEFQVILHMVLGRGACEDLLGCLCGLRL
jgi:hypothetical protein